MVLFIANIFLFISHVTSQLTIIGDTTWFDDFDGLPLPGWTYSDTNGGTTDTITPTPITTYHGPYNAASDTQEIYNIVRDFMCSKKSAVNLRYTVSFCNTETAEYVTSTIQSNSNTHTLKKNGGSSFTDSTLQSESSCSTWKYIESGPFTITSIDANTAFTVSFETGVDWNTEAIALNGINIECNALPTPSPTTSPPTTAEPTSSPTTAIPTWVQTYKTIDDIWDDEYELLPTQGWYTDVDGVEYTDNVRISPNTVRTYHIFEAIDNSANDIFTLEQSFYCNHPESKVSITYNIYYCGTEANDYVILYLDNTAQPTTYIGYAFDGGNGVTWNDDDLEANICTDSNGWEHQTSIGPYFIDSVNQNQLFSVEFVLKLSNGEESIGLSGIQINCDQITDSPTTSTPTTASPTTASPTNVPTETPTGTPTHQPTTAEPTAIPTKAPTDQPTTAEPTVSPTTAEPTSSPTKHPTDEPSFGPTSNPSSSPTLDPSSSPTTASPTSSAPTKPPTIKLTIGTKADQPTKAPNDVVIGTGSITSTFASIDDESDDSDDDEELNVSFVESDSFIYVAVGMVGGLCVAVFCAILIRRRLKAKTFDKNTTEMAKLENNTSPSIKVEGISYKDSKKLASMPTVSIIKQRQHLQQANIAVASPSTTVDQFETNLSSLAGANNILMDDVMNDMMDEDENENDDDDEIDDIINVGSTTAGGPYAQHITAGGPDIDDIDLIEDETEETETPETNDPDVTLSMHRNDDDDDDDDDLLDGIVTMGAPSSSNKNNNHTKGEYNNDVLSDTEETETDEGTSEHDDGLIINNDDDIDDEFIITDTIQ